MNDAESYANMGHVIKNNLKGAGNTRIGESVSWFATNQPDLKVNQIVYSVGVEHCTTK